MKFAAPFLPTSPARRSLVVLMIGLSTLALVITIGIGLRGRGRTEMQSATGREIGGTPFALSVPAPVAERAVATDDAVANNATDNAASRATFEAANASITRQIITTGEQIEGQLRYLHHQVSFSTLAITLAPKRPAIQSKVESWSLGYHAVRAARILLGTARLMATALLYVAIVIGPFALVIGLGLVLHRARRRSIATP